MLYVLCYIKDTNECQICTSIVMSFEIWFPNIDLNTSSSSFSSFSSSHNSCFIKVMALKMLFVVILIILSFVVEIDFG